MTTIAAPAPAGRPWQQGLLGLGGALTLLVLFLPFLLWRRLPVRTLKVLVVDKTVPDSSRREHAGLFWILNHRKFQTSGGAAYRADQDYYGFFPGAGHTWAIREPSIAAAAPELIYLADTYGVYTEEFYGQALGNRTRAIYGGLQPAEVRDLQGALGSCLTLVGEFNTFASPTTGEAREGCERLFGLGWHGWTARFFPDLTRDVEVPPWAVRNYERQSRREWTFEGPGFLFVNEDDRVEVLEDGVDVVADRGLRMVARPAGLERLDLPREARYDYWFDLVQPAPGTEVLADYELPLLPRGEQKLKALGLGRRTPAILSSWLGRTHAYYFAGDFADAWPPPNLLRIRGFAPFRRWTMAERAGDPLSFFWHVYVPVMTRILEETWARRLPAGTAPPVPSAPSPASPGTSPGSP